MKWLNFNHLNQFRSNVLSFKYFIWKCSLVEFFAWALGNVLSIQWAQIIKDTMKS